MKRTSFLILKKTLPTSLMIVGLSIGNAVAAPPAKITICHNSNEISVAAPAVINAHLNHGDTLGTCPAGPAPVVAILETNFAICNSNRHGETGRSIKVDGQGRAEVTKVQCD